MDASTRVTHEAVVEGISGAVDGQDAADHAIGDGVFRFLRLDDAAAATVDKAGHGFVEIEEPEVAVVVDPAVEVDESSVRDLLVAIEIDNAAGGGRGVAADLDVSRHRDRSARFCKGQDAGRDVRQARVSIGSRPAEEHLSRAVLDQAARAGEHAREAGIAVVQHDAALAAVQVEVVGEVDFVVGTRARVDDQRCVRVHARGTRAAPVDRSDVTKGNCAYRADGSEAAAVAGELHLPCPRPHVARKGRSRRRTQYKLTHAGIARVAKGAAELQVARGRQRSRGELHRAGIERRAPRVVIPRVRDVNDGGKLREEQLVNDQAANPANRARDIERLVAPAGADIRGCIEGQRPGQRIGGSATQYGPHKRAARRHAIQCDVVIEGRSDSGNTEEIELRAGEHVDRRARNRVDVSRRVPHAQSARVDVNCPCHSTDNSTRNRSTINPNDPDDEVAETGLGEAEAAVIESRRIDGGATEACIELQRTGAGNGDRRGDRARGIAEDELARRDRGRAGIADIPGAEHPIAGDGEGSRARLGEGQRAGLIPNQAAESRVRGITDGQRARASTCGLKVLNDRQREPSI